MSRAVFSRIAVAAHIEVIATLFLTFQEKSAVPVTKSIARNLSYSTV